ncbi:MAG: hypothetical protein IJ272_10320 [Clostridia bacterium]|nr:hypothetical protein [Clostridia bacterium]
MATMICGHSIFDGNHIFYTQDRDVLEVLDFKDGVVKLDPLCGTSIDSYAKAVAGCFRVRSNFKRELAKVFVTQKNIPLKQVPFETITFNFNGVTVVVNRENADAKKIYAQWHEKFEESIEQQRREHEEYMKTPEYRAKRAKELKYYTRRENVEKDVITVSKTEAIEFKDEEAANKWENWVQINSNDPYSFGVVTYAKYWAKYMQHLMRKHNKSVKDIAEQTSHVCDIEGITGFMYGCAVSILAEVWKYGDDLKSWHNKEWGCENCDGVVNPAIITIESPAT